MSQAGKWWPWDSKPKAPGFRDYSFLHKVDGVSFSPIDGVFLVAGTVPPQHN